ncbi:MAG: MgtC/SapB family protein [Actinomycetales bacterium]|jgi:putative Mg2+ transporter-C (MgtC) family protein
MGDAALGSLDGQGLLQIGELLLAFVLSSMIGLERQLRRKSAGLRTQAIVGTTAALLLLVSKYGFTDVLIVGHIVLDPSRVAAQIVSGVGFLGAGLILTKRGAVRGLTTAAAVWETAAIGMAAGAGLWLLAMVVTALHFLVAYGYTPLTRLIPGSADKVVELEFTYLDGKGILRAVLAVVTRAGWTISRLSFGDAAGPMDDAGESVRVDIEVSGSSDPSTLLQLVGNLSEVSSVRFVAQEDLD